MPQVAKRVKEQYHDRRAHEHEKQAEDMNAESVKAH